MSEDIFKCSPNSQFTVIGCIVFKCIGHSYIHKFLYIDIYVCIQLNTKKIIRTKTIPNNLKLCSLKTLTLKNTADFLNPTVLHFEKKIFKRRFVEECFIQIYKKMVFVLRFEAFQFILRLLTIIYKP